MCLYLKFDFVKLIIVNVLNLCVVITEEGTQVLYGIALTKQK